jgi:hypothetical protein
VRAENNPSACSHQQTSPQGNNRSPLQPCSALQQLVFHAVPRTRSSKRHQQCHHYRCHAQCPVSHKDIMSTRIVTNSVAISRELIGFSTDTARKDSFQQLCTQLVNSGPQLSGAGNYLPILLCFNLFTIAFVLALRRRRGLVGLVGSLVGVVFLLGS